MEPFDFIAQAVGIVAMLFVSVSYQSKKQKSIFALQFFGTMLFIVHFFMIGAIMGALLNALATVRAAVFLFKDKLKADRWPWFIAFVVAYFAAYVLNFTLFDKEVTPLNLVIELLPVVGMVALHLGFRLKKAADIRRCGLVASPSWLIYNILAGSWGGAICDSLSLGSIIVGMWRHDKKKKQK